MYTLGINAAFHDPAAALVNDGIVLAAAPEERFTHIKHDERPIPFSTYEIPFHPNANGKPSDEIALRGNLLRVHLATPLSRFGRRHWMRWLSAHFFWKKISKICDLF